MSQEVTYSPNNPAGIYVPTATSTAAAASANSAANSLSSASAKPASTYELKTSNPFTSQSSTSDSTGTGEAASAAAAAAGLPYVAPAVVNQIYTQNKTDPALQQLKQQMLFFASLNATGAQGTGSGGSSSTAGQAGAGGGGPQTKSLYAAGSGGAGAGADPTSAAGGQPISIGAGNTGAGNTGSGNPSGTPDIPGMGSALSYNDPIPQLSAAGRAAVNSTGQNVWALVVVALKGAMEDQNETLQYDLNKLKMYGTMSDQMSAYSQVLEQTQTNLDGAIQNQKDDNKKGNQEVEMPTQLSFGPSSMFTLDNNGNMLPQTTSNPENAKNNANPVSAQGLNAKLQTFQQQRDQLQKNIDHWTNQYQSDNEVKNQLTTTITSILKNMYDMQGAVTRNINL